MYSLIIDTFIWSFAIYGFLNFLEEYFLESICYIICKFIYIIKLFKNFIAKKDR